MLAVLGYFIAAMSPNLDIANASLPAYVGSLLFFVGCLLRVKDMPGYWQWYSYLNFLRYGWGALMVNQFEGKNAIFLGGEEVRNVAAAAPASLLVRFRSRAR